jgi:NADP-reducing hydrogenase subunit HndD
LTGKPLKNPDFTAVRGMRGVKEAAIELNGVKVKVCVINGIANAKEVLEKVKAGTSGYHFIEIMTCPGGCVNGGGQPIHPEKIHAETDVRGLRAAALYAGDRKKAVRKSHESKAVKAFYDEFFGAPNSGTAHEILHTGYAKREKYR